MFYSLKDFVVAIKNENGILECYFLTFQVDNNVTRHVKPALSNPHWDALILHYLGLDHIGHLGGPTSPLVSPKLLEMDGVIRNIHQALIEQVKEICNN